MATHSSILAWRIPWTEDVAGHSPQRLKESGMTEVTMHAPTSALCSIYYSCDELLHYILKI